MVEAAGIEPAPIENTNPLKPFVHKLTHGMPHHSMPLALILHLVSIGEALPYETARHLVGAYASNTE
jgi:hypothetical protein